MALKKKNKGPFVNSTGQKNQKIRNRQIIIGIVIAMLLTFYLSLHVSKLCFVDGVRLTEALDKGLTNGLKNPLNIIPVTGQMLQAAGFVTFIVAAIGAVIWIEQKMRHHDMAGIEQGSAKWNDDIEGYKKQYMDEDYQKNMLFSNDLGLSMNGKQTFRNNNVLVIGGSGTGKTRYVLKPNLMQCNCSYIITDPSGDILADIGPVLEKNGYVIKVFNIIEMNKSMCYNPLNYIRDEAGVAMLVNCLIKNTGESGGDNKFWDQAITALLEAIILMMITYCPEEERNFSNVMRFLRAADVPDERNPRSQLDIVFEQIEKINKNDLSLKFYKTFKMSAGKTLKNILISAAVRLTVFNFPSVQNLTDVDTIDLTSIGDEKQALFIITPQADDTYSFLVAMMYSQLFESLYHHAEYECGWVIEDKDHLIARPFPGEKEAKDFLALLKENAERIRNNKEELIRVEQNPLTGRYAFYDIKKDTLLLKELRPEISDAMLNDPDSFKVRANGMSCPIHVRMLMDEFANLGEIPNFERVIATVRRYNISTTVILQSLTQIKAMYEKTYETIIACCDSLIFLGSSEETTVKYLSEVLGNRTITVRGTGKSMGKSVSSSQNYSQQKRALATPDELIMMDRSNAIVSINGIYPFMIQKFDLTKHPRYNEIADSGKVKPYLLEDHFDNSARGAVMEEEVEKEGEAEKIDISEVANDLKDKKNNLVHKQYSVEALLTSKVFEEVQQDKLENYEMVENEVGGEDFLLVTQIGG